jgi:outer membrane protein assembly factor BamA
LGFALCQLHASSSAQTDDITSEISDSSKITKIEFDGNHLINESDIVKVMNMQIGDVYSKELVQQNLKAIYKTGYFSEKMNVLVQNTTEYITGACYDLTTKQKLAKSKPSKRLGRKAVGSKVFKPRQPDSRSFNQLF